MGVTITNRRFTVVMRGPSPLAFPESQNLQIDKVPTAAGPVQVKYATRWLRSGDVGKLPGHLWIEIQGGGDTLENVLVPYANAGISALPMLSVAANASIPEPDVEIGFDCTEGVRERDYFQSHMAGEGSVLHTGRLIDTGVAVAVIEALSRHREAERLLRAANQYRLALESWRAGRESLSLAHLWMALEALTKVRIRRDCAAAGHRSEDELAAVMGIEKKQLDSTIRMQLLDRDAECYRKAKKASDGFEHGFLGYDTIRQFAKDVHRQLATHVRRAIFTLGDVSASATEIAMAHPFDKPLGHWPLARYLRGQIVGESSRLAQEGSEYPFVRWNTEIVGYETGGPGEPQLTVNENFSPELGEGLEFRRDNFEVWNPD